MNKINYNVEVKLYRNGERIKTYKATENETIDSCLTAIKLYGAEAIQFNSGKVVDLKEFLEIRKNEGNLKIKDFITNLLDY